MSGRGLGLYTDHIRVPGPHTYPLNTAGGWLDEVQRKVSTVSSSDRIYCIRIICTILRLHTEEYPPHLPPLQLAFILFYRILTIFVTVPDWGWEYVTSMRDPHDDLRGKAAVPVTKTAGLFCRIYYEVISSLQCTFRCDLASRFCARRAPASTGIDAAMTATTHGIVC